MENAWIHISTLNPTCLSLVDFHLEGLATHWWEQVEEQGKSFLCIELNDDVATPASSRLSESDINHLVIVKGFGYVGCNLDTFCARQ